MTGCDSLRSVSTSPDAILSKPNRKIENPTQIACRWCAQWTLRFLILFWKRHINVIISFPTRTLLVLLHNHRLHILSSSMPVTLHSLMSQSFRNGDEHPDVSISARRVLVIYLTDCKIEIE
nr:unnamed protein product [Haemonchus contortus]